MTEKEYDEKYEAVYRETLEEADRIFSDPHMPVSYCTECCARNRQKGVVRLTDMTTECARCFVRRRIREKTKDLERERDSMKLDLEDFKRL